ncbi:hypothetical protein KUTeg_021677 [Tegillarca granosa]|uniref:Uncharacterized protein n=1 Tax=Tegillarca granosa TaxID=220873 RepID=A0ABQ9E415_TEGGR|nr:hypothetical protein KUTeg_021677 [Tegillarca granosa]
MQNYYLHIYTPITAPGTVYTRWGRKTCGNDSNISELIYEGQVAGSDNYHHTGAAVNYLCLPQTPIYGNFDSKENSNAHVYGAEIDPWHTNIPGTPFEHSKYNTKSIYCAVCRTNGRTSVVMIPGRNQCFSGWKREYHGYLAAGHYSHKGASEYICLDEQPDIFPTQNHSWHKILYSVEGRCTGPLKCPPYVNGKELTCVELSIHDGEERRQVAGSHYRHSGAAVNYLCLPQSPIYGHYDSRENGNAYVYGAEIEPWKTNIPGTPFEYTKYNRKSIYCAVCRTNGRLSVVMIPGRNQCFPGWNREYHGYLAAGFYAHKAATEYICLDEKPDIFPTKSHSWHTILYSVEGRCTGPLKCPPYVNGRELTCVHLVTIPMKQPPNTSALINNQTFFQHTAINIYKVFQCVEGRYTGRNKCFPGWKREYHGYLAPCNHSHEAATEYICLDKKPHIFPTYSNKIYKVFHSVEGRCTVPLKYPSYVNDKELT